VEPVEVGVSELVALVNQTFEYAYPSVTVVGELSNMRVSKGKWLYFDLKDDTSSVKFFGTVFMLPGPLEDGMLVKVTASPRLHNLYGFSMNVRSIQPAGEGSIKKAAALLQAKLTAEGLFDADRKRPLPYPPTRIGLVTSRQSAAYADFIKILDARWGGVQVDVIDVQVQGEPAPRQIVAAIEQFNATAEPPDILVLIRGGGSADDLAAFSTEQVTRAVAASRVPTLVAIGHEVDLSLAELAADQRASTPSNAAELMVPDRQDAVRSLQDTRKQLDRLLMQQVTDRQDHIDRLKLQLDQSWRICFDDASRELGLRKQLLLAYDPQAALKRGYAVLRSETGVITSVKKLSIGTKVSIEMHDGKVDARVE
jgi:exodeoxyribonuclease VII large subunit